MPPERDWRGESAAHGLTLSDDDLAFIRDQVERVKAALASHRSPETDGLEPPYAFRSPKVRQSRTSPRARRSRPSRG